jgi:hypothetical protein
MLLNMISKFNSRLANNVDEASGPPLIEQSGWFITYDIRVDQSEYTYIQQNGYYNAATQQGTEKSKGELLPIPQTGQESMFNPPLPPLARFGALEVKAAWRVLDPVGDKATIPRYLCADRLLSTTGWDDLPRPGPIRVNRTAHSSADAYCTRHMVLGHF